MKDKKYRSRAVQGLTPRQLDLLIAIEDYLEVTQGVSPTYDELAKELDTTKSNVYRIALALIDRGFISVRPNEARSIKLRRLNNYGA